MPSPFPGMNPYLERRTVWHDFHNGYLYACRDALASQVSENFVVRVDENVYFHEIDGAEHRSFGRPDLSINALGRESGGVAVAASFAPAQLELELPEYDEERLSYLEIRDRDQWTVLTVIELLSPTNKYRGTNREKFLNKRLELLHSQVHYIEIDLLRGGPRVPEGELPACDYYAMVSRRQQRPRVDFWPIALRERLPSISVPLSAGHAEVLLDLQAPLHRVYDGARYGNYIYRGEPEPLLAEADQEWAKGLIAKRETAGTAPVPGTTP